MSGASSSIGADNLSAAAFEDEQDRRARDGAIRPPHVSVIVLNFNGEKIIGCCLDHLIAQTYRDFEIILVDNNSADGSLAVAERYLGCGKLSFIRASRNLGVPGGRNLGLTYAKGDIIAFIDNDGYADRNWLAAAVRVLESDDKIGAVASVVFFADRKIILNACGGTINWQGYGQDFCYDDPYEFADIPRQVLYPMGCGMVLRRQAFDHMRRFDSLPIKWYEDTELGIWLWSCGYKVVVAEDAWIDHGWGFSDGFLPSRRYMCERARIRTVLKYYPARRLVSWLSHEVRHLKSAAGRSLLAKAWMWNLRHLPSALIWRLRILRHKTSFWHLLDPSWGYFSRPPAENRANHLDLAKAQSVLLMDGKDDIRQLNFGWYYAESDSTRTFRWSAPHASVLFRLREPVLSCTVTFLGLPSKRTVRILVRAFGSLKPLNETAFDLSPPGWMQRTFHVHLPAGCYELLLFCDNEYIDPAGRRLGVAVSLIRFE